MNVAAQTGSSYFTNQKNLLHQLHQIFPSGIQVNVRKDFNLTNVDGNYLELDIWIPQHQLAFEFQDMYHYRTTWYTQRPNKVIQQEDDKKSAAVRQLGESLLVVPCWWDGSLERLAAAISFYRPDLKLNYDFSVVPFPLNPVIGFFPVKEVPDVGELMAASFPIDQYFYSSFPDKTWWIGEKYDGVRCSWNAKSVYTRSGAEIDMLPAILFHLPSKSFLDGELWFGRGLYSSTYALFSDEVDDIQWSTLRMISFDIPPTMNFEVGFTFEERYEKLLDVVHPTNPFNIVAPRVLGESERHLNLIKESIISHGGEGVILRKVNSSYEHGKSSDLLKLKTAFGDKEALVLEVGRLKDIKLKLPNGVTFSVSAESVHVPQKLKSGDIVSFSYEIHSRRDVPSNPKIFRVRTDLSWEDVLFNSSNDTSQVNELGGFSAKPQRYWSIKNMRVLLESCAKQKGLDPLLSETWYNISESDIRHLKGGETVLRKFSGYVQALIRLFPDITFDTSRFLSPIRNKWNKVTNRRRFFEDYARLNSFDPLVALNWNLHKEKILTSKETISALKYHKFEGGYFRMLQKSFPEIGLDKNAFNIRARWQDIRARRKFFEHYAKENGFDPLKPENWLSQSKEKIMTHKGARSVVFHHNNSLSAALSDLFGFENLKIRSNKPAESTFRREVFEKYAKEKGFDPLVPHNWYSQTRANLLSFEGVRFAILYHKNSVILALLELFPEIGLKKEKLERLSALWHKPNRRKLFETYARLNNFDHLSPEAWYSQSSKQILSHKGVRRAIYYHNNSLAQTLLDLFPEIGLSSRKMPSFRPEWNLATSRRKFFQDFAADWGFDYNTPANWYSLPKDALFAEKGSKRVLSFHGNSMSQALVELFPEINFDLPRFGDPHAKLALHEPESRRRVFEKYARENKFDPLNPENWYSHSKSRKILSFKGMLEVIGHHKLSVKNALLSLFPDIGLEKSKL